MDRMVRFRRITLLLLIACSCFVLLGVDASYAAESPIYLQKSPGTFTHPSIFGAKLGRLTINSSTPMYNPTILITGVDSSYNVYLIGPLRWSETGTWNYTKEIQMNVLAVSYPEGLGGTAFIRAIKDKQPLLGGWSNQEVTTTPFYVDIYLVNANDYGGTTNTGLVSNLNSNGAFFKLDSPYTFKNLFNPHFTIGITDALDQGPYVFPEAGAPTQGQFIPIDGVVGQGTTPVVDPNGYTSGEGGNDGFWYGDQDPQPVSYLFSFLENSVSFDLSAAYGNKKKEINTARMEVVNGVVGGEYAQKVTFSTTGTTNSFQLKPVIGDGFGIDFTLYFGSGQVLYGTPILWDELAPAMNTRSLSIGNIDESQVLERVGGGYQVTICITITNND